MGKMRYRAYSVTALPVQLGSVLSLYVGDLDLVGLCVLLGSSSLSDVSLSGATLLGRRSWCTGA